MQQCLNYKLLNITPLYTLFSFTFTCILLFSRSLSHLFVKSLRLNGDRLVSAMLPQDTDPTNTALARPTVHLMLQGQKKGI